MWRPLVSDVRQQQAFLDLLTKAWIADYASSGKTIFCRRGCRECCNLVVNATFTEAVALAAVLPASLAEAVRRHVARLVERLHGVSDLKEYLRIHRREIGFCPLLADDGACAVYESRPLSCRALLSTREKKWCAIDFSGLSRAEKEQYLEELDRDVVAFPVHYVAAMRDAGEEMEAVTARRMTEQFGFSIYGNFPVLLHLVLDHGLADACIAGRSAVVETIAAAGLDNPLFVQIEGGDDGEEKR